MSLTFEWDRRKADSNLRRHGVSFDEATTVFADVRSLTIADPDHSEKEDRFVLLGMSAKGRMVVVVHTDRSENIRMISARLATRRETQEYEEG